MTVPCSRLEPKVERDHSRRSSPGSEPTRRGVSCAGLTEAGATIQEADMAGPIMNRREFGRAALALGAGLAGLPSLPAEGQAAKPAPGMPAFRVDPDWPKIPNNWIFGPVTTIRVDEQDHVWILQRRRSIRAG